MQNDLEVKNKVISWLEGVVIGLNLCPFANRPYLSDQVRIEVMSSADENDLIECLVEELMLLDSRAAEEVETTLVVVPWQFERFDDYNEFLYLANELLKSGGWEGRYQIASFHPGYQFADTNPDDQENFTNRAPYPIFHLIREHSLEKALAAYPDHEEIPDRNIELLNSMSPDKIRNLFSWCFDAK